MKKTVLTRNVQIDLCKCRKCTWMFGVKLVKKSFFFHTVKWMFLKYIFRHWKVLAVWGCCFFFSNQQLIIYSVNAAVFSLVRILKVQKTGNKHKQDKKNVVLMVLLFPCVRTGRACSWHAGQTHVRSVYINSTLNTATSAQRGLSHSFYYITQ